MNRKIQNRVLETISRHSMFRPGDRVGLGVSGGADSVALLCLLAELRAKLGIGIVVVHFHHQLRGVDADEDERFVEILAAEFHFEFISGRGDVAGEAARNGWNLEDAARRMRYQFFASAATSRKLNRVAVAHSMDDQAETVLAHLLRGTGLTGLAGIYPVVDLIVRPLLEIGRDEIREYLHSLGRSWREDASNQDISRTRARIRHQLLPVLRADFEPAAVTRLARLADLARDDETFWRALEDERFPALTVREPSGNISLRVADLVAPLPMLASNGNGRNPEFPETPTLALSRRLVRRIVAELRGDRQQLTARHVQDVFDLAAKSSSGARIELPGINVERMFDRLVFSVAKSGVKEMSESDIDENTFPNREFQYQIFLPDPSTSACIVVPEIQKRFHLKVIDWPSAPRETSTHRGTLDLDRLRWPLILRNWLPGDSYRPQGHRRVRKLKRLFLESRIPRTNRESWPVLTCEGQLVWASGYPAADEYAPHSETQTGLMIVEEKFTVDCG